MKRTLSLTTLLPLSLVSPLALALGLGNAEVGSTLNAPLRATIPLTDTAGLQAGLLNASLADAEAYRAAGLTRTPLAASVEMAIRRRQGRLVLELSTERAVREPWLDLLLRFDWPGGRQLREMTLLLDPPDYAAMPALVEGGGQARVAAASAPSSPTTTSRSVRAATPRGSGDPARVRSGDTLWAVAGRLRPDSGIGMNQMMLALVEANPEVFPTGNINEMRAGFTLTVPPREAIAARSPARAAELVQAMNSAWANRGSGAPAAVPLGPSEPAVAEAPEASPATEAAADPAAGDGERGGTPRLTLLTDEEVAAGLGDEGADEGGADSGDGVAAGGDAGASPDERLDPTVLASILGTGALTEDARLLRLEQRFQESRDALANVQAERDALEAEVGGLREELEALRERVAALAAGGAGVEGAGAGGVVPPASSRQGDAGQASGWWGALYQGAVERPLMLGGSALALLLALWALVRRRRHEERSPTQSPAAAFGEPQVIRPPGEPASPNAGGDAAGVAGRPARAGMPEAEAISEADIFIAYGRYDQARDLLEAGVAREPERQDLRLKLLRVQLEQGDRAGAEAQAEHLRASDDEAIRAEVARLMGRAAGETEAAPAAERAVFSAADERPPRHFGDHDEASAADASAVSAAAPSAEAPEDLARYRPPAIEPEEPAAAGSAAEPDPAPAPEASPDPGPEGSASPQDVKASVEASDDGDATAPSEPEMPRVATREKEDGSRIIDYRPPSLEPATPREEAPSQPSVEFAPEEEVGRARDERSWEVEEVAFPPLDEDNGGSDDAASATATLNEARHLIEVGEVREARVMLERFLEASDDAAARQEARDLLDRHQP